MECAGSIRGLEFRGEEDLGAGDAGGLEALADLGLVVVGEGGIDMAVTSAKSGLNGVLNLTGGGLPCAEANSRHLVARVELCGFPVSPLANRLLPFHNRQMGDILCPGSHFVMCIVLSD